MPVPTCPIALPKNGRNRPFSLARPIAATSSSCTRRRAFEARKFRRAPPRFRCGSRLDAAGSEASEYTPPSLIAPEPQNRARNRLPVDKQRFPSLGSMVLWFCGMSPHAHARPPVRASREGLRNRTTEPPLINRLSVLPPGPGGTIEPVRPAPRHNRLCSQRAGVRNRKKEQSKQTEAWRKLSHALRKLKLSAAAPARCACLAARVIVRTPPPAGTEPTPQRPRGRSPARSAPARRSATPCRTWP